MIAKPEERDETVFHDRVPGTQTIFCDESGFSGNNLLDKDQPFFAYAAVAIEPDEAQEIVKRTRVDAGLDPSMELKSSSLVSSAHGRKVLSRAIKQFGERSVVFAAHKKYALACKFFEYVFEPVLAERNSFFYERGLHKFVANLLFLHMVVGDATAEEMAAAFQKFMRSRDFADIEKMFQIPGHTDEHPIGMMLNVARAHSGEIGEELNVLASTDAVGKWVLDLTTSCLFRLLGWLGERYERLAIYCDASKPLQSDTLLFNSMIDRPERSFMTFENRVVPVTFDLDGAIRFVDSQSHPGVQLADLLAGAFTYFLKHDMKVADLVEAIGDVPMLPIGPDPSLIALDSKSGFMNMVLLKQLEDRALSGHGTLDSLIAEHLMFEAYYDHNPPGISGTAKSTLV